MTANMKKIPGGLHRIKLQWWNCGDTCDCNCFKIIGTKSDEDRPCIELWESTWFESIAIGKNEILDDLFEALDYYRLPHDKDELRKFEYYDWDELGIERILG